MQQQRKQNLIDTPALLLIDIAAKLGALPLLMSVWKTFHMSQLLLGYACQGEIGYIWMQLGLKPLKIILPFRAKNPVGINSTKLILSS